MAVTYLHQLNLLEKTTVGSSASLLATITPNLFCTTYKYVLNMLEDAVTADSAEQRLALRSGPLHRMQIPRIIY